MTHTSDQIGAAAQATIERWVVGSGGVHARPSLDVKGWDLFVQLPASSIRSMPLDKRPADLGFCLQIKGTNDLDLRGIKLNLSTAADLAKVPTPGLCVVLASPTPSFDEISKVWLLPFDEALVTRILGELTRVDGEGASPSKDLWVPLTVENEVLPATRESVIGRMTALIEQGAALQGDAKIDLVTKAGYESHPIGVKLGRFNVRQLALAALGLHDRVEVFDVEITERRFGVERQQRRLDGEYRLAVAGGGDDVELGFGARPHSTMYARFRSTEAVFREPPPSMRGVRFENRFIDLVLSDIDGAPNGFNATPPIPVDEAISLYGELIGFARCVRAIEDALAAKAASCPIFVNGAAILSLPLGGLHSPIFGTDTDGLVRAILDAEEVARSFDLPRDLCVPLGQLMGQATELGHMRAFLGGQTIPDLRVELGDAGDPTKLWVVPGTVSVLLGNNPLSVIFTVSGQPKPLPDGPAEGEAPASITHTLTGPRITVEAKAVLSSATKEALRAWLSAEADKLIAKYALRSEEEHLVFPREFLELIEPSAEAGPTVEEPNSP